MEMSSSSWQFLQQPKLAQGCKNYWMTYTFDGSQQEATFFENLKPFRPDLAELKGQIDSKFTDKFNKVHAKCTLEESYNL